MKHTLAKCPHGFEPVVLKYPEEIKDLISVIIPIYNTELYIREALDSLIAQTFENWEAILVDDGSTNKCPEICAGYVEKDSRFKYIRKIHEGTLLARKIGLENSRGEFIANLDSDDIYHPQFLEKMFAKIKEEDNDFVYCNFKSLGVNYKDYQAEYYKLSDNKLENCYNTINKITETIWSKLVKRNIYAKVLFPQIGDFRSEDTVQTVQITYHSKKAEFVPECLYFYRDNSIYSIANTTNVVSKERRYVRRIIGVVLLYVIIEKFFGSDEAEVFIADIKRIAVAFSCYFLLNKDVITRHEIKYVENFVPVFLSGLSKAKRIRTYFKIILILACKGFTLPYKIYDILREIRDFLKNS